MKALFTYLLISIAIINHELNGQDLISNYNISFELDLSNNNWTKNTLKGKATIRFTDSSKIHKISFILNRLLDVDSVLIDGQKIPFKQDLTMVENWETYQVNHVYIDNLNTPERITIFYHGKIASYTETGMLYVQEKLDQDFFIIRPESLSFPQIAFPTSESILGRWRAGDLTDYDINIKVNKGYICASAINLINTEQETFTGTLNEVKQLTVPIAKYDTITTLDYTIFHFPEDSVGAKTISHKISQAIMNYQDWFGPRLSNNKFIVAEIPEGYGSQAIFPLIIQTADAFNNNKQDVQLYHELSHFWNIDDSNATYSNRLNEGLAMFLQYLVKSKIDSSFSLESVIEKRFQRSKNQIASSETNQLAISQFGAEQKTNLSYTTGLIFFSLLYDSNPQKFLNNYRAFYQSNKNSNASDETLLSSFTNEKVCKKIIHEWYKTNQYVERVSKASSYFELLNSYKELD